MEGNTPDQKATNCMSPFICNSGKAKLGTENRLSIARAGVGEGLIEAKGTGNIVE